MTKTLDITNPSLNKRWFGYRTECGLEARFALLVNYECKDGGGVKAFIYATNECFEGEALDVLSRIAHAIDAEFKKQLNKAPPPRNRGFMTQSWQGETKPVTSGELFYIEPWEYETYVPAWKK